MSDIPGATNALPGVFTLVQTQAAGAAIPGGSRVTAMIGQGQTNGTIVAQAQGGGLDGLDPTYTSTSGSDGRHFLITGAPLIPNRTTLFLNGIPLVGMESVITATTTFSNQFQYLLDPETGEILLQSAYIVNQGGAFYVPLSTNVGLGVINGLTLVDVNAPPETWTVRCIAVQRNSMNQPIGGTAQFIAIGSVSGAQVDANGNPIIWMVANGSAPSILSFGILAGSGITNTGASTVTGDVGTYPTTTETGFGTLTINGTNHMGDSVTQAAKTALTAAYNNAQALPGAVTIPTDLNGQTLTPGVYSSLSGTFMNTGTLTLNGAGNYTFQMATTLITAASSTVVLTGGATAANITWAVGSSATLGTSSHLEGSILALTSITATTGATVNGSLLAQNGAVTLDTNTITATATPSTSPSGTVSNGILKFSISETQVMNVVVSPFVPGDAFTIIVNSGVLLKNDALTATYIPVANINAPTLTQGLNQVVTQFGTPSLDNSLSLGAQLFYANGASSLICVQAAPPLPRRTFFNLSPSVNAASTNDDDFIFPLPVGVVPAFDDDIYFFVTNNSTQVETQLLPNKQTYYTLGTAGNPTQNQFIMSNAPAPTGFSYFYTVIQSFETVVSGYDGYIAPINSALPNQGAFSSSVTFDNTYIGLELKVIDAVNFANINTYTVTNVVNGVLYVTGPVPLANFTNQNPTTFELIDPVDGLPVTGGSGTDGVLTIAGAGLGNLTSTAVDFSPFNSKLNINGYQLQINGSANNDGLYYIVGFDSITNTLTLQTTVVSEHNLRYEVINPALESNYIVVNHNVVPNGYGLSVSLVDNRDATFYDAGWINALAALETVECDILVPLPNQTISVIFQNCVNHCIAMSNIVNKKERVLFIGAINGLTPANLTGAQLAAVEDLGPLEGIPGSNPSLILQANPQDLANYSVAAAYGDTYRVVYFYPDQIIVAVSSGNILIDGFYIAAAAAGYESADIIIQNPITNKVFSGFTILGNKTFSTLTLEQLAAAGVCTLQPVAGGGTVIWGITTSQSGFPEEQEVSIIFIRDRVAKTLRAAFKGFIGTPQDVNTAAALNTEAVETLNSLVGQGLLTAYTNLNVYQDTVDPRQWNVSVLVSPAFPINWIFITVNVGNLNLASSTG
jgi:hypothetical protein